MIKNPIKNVEASDYLRKRRKLSGNKTWKYVVINFYTDFMADQILRAIKMTLGPCV